MAVTSINQDSLDDFELLNEQFTPQSEDYTGNARYFIRIYGNALVGLLQIFPVGKTKGEQIFTGNLTEVRIPRTAEKIIITLFSADGRKSKIFEVNT